MISKPVVFVITFIKFAILLPITNRPTKSSVSTCLSEIFGKYLMCTQKISVHFTTQADEIAGEILRDLNTTKLINTVEHRPASGTIDKRMLTDLVLILDSAVDVAGIINTTLWFGDTYFLVVSNSKDVDNIFREFWNSKIVNVFTFVENPRGVFTFYSFLPYEPNNCSVGTPILIDKCINGTFETGNIGQINNKERLKNMNDCPINVTMTDPDATPHVIFKDECNCNGTKHASGVEGKLIVEFSKFMNFNASYYLPRDNGAWGFIKPKPAGAIGEVYTGHSEFAIGFLGPIIQRYENLDFSIQFTPMECISFGVPRGQRAKQKVWISFLIYEFTDTVWLCTSMSFVIIMLAFLGVNKLSVVDRRFRKKADMMFFVVSTIIGVPVKSPKFEVLRILFIFLVLFNIIFTAAYQSALSSKLIVPTVDKDIETFDQLLESKLELTGAKNVYYTFYDNRNETIIGKLVKRFKITNQSLESAIEEMTYKKNIAYGRHKSSFLYYSLLNEESRGAVNTLKECVYVYYPVVMMKKYSPFTNQLNKVIDRLVRGGIINYWKSFYIYDVPPNPDVLMKLNMEKCKGIFIFLAGGMIVALMAFIGEKLYFKSFKIK